MNNRLKVHDYIFKKSKWIESSEDKSPKSYKTKQAAANFQNLLQLKFYLFGARKPACSASEMVLNIRTGRVVLA